MKKYKSAQLFLQVSFALVILYNVFFYIPRINRNWDELTQLEPSYVFGYIVGGSWFWFVLILFLITKYLNPERILARNGFKKDLVSLRKAKKANVITEAEYNLKIEELFKSYQENKRKINTKSTASIDSKENYDTSIKELDIFLQQRTIDQFEYNKNKVKLKIIHQPTEVTQLELGHLIHGIIFSNEDKVDDFDLKGSMAEQRNNELLEVILSNEYSSQAIYHAYKELMSRFNK